jgi:hypothetical protein
MTILAQALTLEIEIDIICVTATYLKVYNFLL